jgi:hypothetical protein
MKVEIHHAQPYNAGDNVFTLESVKLQELFLLFIQPVVFPYAHWNKSNRGDRIRVRNHIGQVISIRHF